MMNSSVVQTQPSEKPTVLSKNVSYYLESPSRLSQSPQNRIVGLSQDLSASTLQHSSIIKSFSKAPRFPSVDPNRLERPMVSLPSTLSPKGTGIGYGSKLLMSKLNTEAAETPAPNFYSPKHWTHGSPKGKTFGLSYTAYKKVYTPQTNMILPEIAREMPGPGAYYDNNAKFGNSSKVASIKSRGRMFNEVVGEKAPPCGHYNPKTAITEHNRYANISFGSSGRSDFTKGTGNNPGPGSYSFTSQFEQMEKRKQIEDKLRAKLKLIKAQ